MAKEFLSGSTLGVLADSLASYANQQLSDLVHQKTEDIFDIKGDFLSLALKAFGFTVIESFLQNGKKFFNALPVITTFDGFLELIESIFLTTQVKVEYLAPAKIALTVVNKNTKLLAVFNDKDKNIYFDGVSRYISFSSHELLGLEDFFKHFLQKFLPAGVVLEKITLTLGNKNNK